MAEDTINPNDTDSSGGGAVIRIPGWVTSLGPFFSLIPIFGVVTGLLVFLGRLYLESYYSYFGIPPSSLDLDIQDYTFGSFQLVLFVLVVMAFILGYWFIMPTAWLGDLLKSLNHSIGSSFNAQPVHDLVNWVNNLRDSVKNAKERSMSRESENVRFLKNPIAYMWNGICGLPDSILNFIFYMLAIPTFLALYLLVYLFIFTVAVLIFIGFLLIVASLLLISISILGVSISTTVVTVLSGGFVETDWNLWNIVGLRGIFSGILLAAGAVVIISVVEALVPEGGSNGNGKGIGRRGRKEWVAPGVLVFLFLFAMPPVTHFMAREQAIADLNTDMSRFEASLPVARFVSTKQLNGGEGWSEECDKESSLETSCVSPEFKVVLINDDKAYVVLNEEATNNKDLNLLTVELDDVDYIRYIAPIGSKAQDESEAQGENAENSDGNAQSNGIEGETPTEIANK